MEKLSAVVKHLEAIRPLGPTGQNDASKPEAVVPIDVHRSQVVYVPNSPHCAGLELRRVGLAKAEEPNASAGLIGRPKMGKLFGGGHPAPFARMPC